MVTRNSTFLNWGAGMLSEIGIILAIGVLTLAILGIIFLASYVKLWRDPPQFLVSINLPDEFTLIQQKLPSKIETDKPDVVPLPEMILDYINLESDEWAQDARKRRARALYRDSNDWNIVFRQMQKEDSPIDEVTTNFNG